MTTQTRNEYLLLFRGTGWHKGLSPEELQRVMSQFKEWFDRLTEQGKLKGAQPLVPEGRIVSGKLGRTVSDGPFAESKEALGGYFLLGQTSATGLTSTAVPYSKSCPTLEYGTAVEVRPVAEVCPMMEIVEKHQAAEELASARA